MLSLPPPQIHTESQAALTLGMSVLHLPFVLRTYTIPAVRMTTLHDFYPFSRSLQSKEP